MLAPGRRDEDIGVLGGGGDGGDPAGVSHKGAAERELLSHVFLSNGDEKGEKREKEKRMGREWGENFWVKKGTNLLKKGTNLSGQGIKKITIQFF